MSVFKSRRLMTFILTQITSGIALAVGLFVKDPGALQLATWFIGFVQGLGGILILAYTIDDTRLNTAQVKGDTEVQLAAINAGTHPDYPPVQSDTVYTTPNFQDQPAVSVYPTGSPGYSPDHMDKPQGENIQELRF